MSRLLKRIGFLALLFTPSLTQAEEIQPEFFIHDLTNATALFKAAEMGCGTIDEDVYKFLIRGSADYLMDTGASRILAAQMLNALAIEIVQSTERYINYHGCDKFNSVMFEYKDDYKIINDVFEIYNISFDSEEIHL